MNSIIKSKRRILMITFILQILLSVTITNGTNIKWIPADDGKDANTDSTTANKSVPRRYSQKYWDEHGVKLPDYAKTDEEVEKSKNDVAENGNNATYFWNILLLIILVLSVCAIIQFKRGGSRLGTSADNKTTTTSIFALFGWNSQRHHLSIEEERRLRLARFEADDDHGDVMTDVKTSQNVNTSSRTKSC